MLLVSFCVKAQHSKIFPQPNGMTVTEQSYSLRNEMRISATPAEQQTIDLYAGRFKEKGMTISYVATGGDIAVRSNPDLHAEGYLLNVGSGGIAIDYRTAAGLFYAFETLFQWMQNDHLHRGSGAIAGVSINDAPQYDYRGVHLDCARHFFTIAEIKGFIDQAAKLKLNTFHWHLTDDQGWRIEIKQYPKLTEIGAWRDSTIVGHYSRSPRVWEHERYGGFYTQEEAREIVRYAAARGMTVVPEIELPGHARAALAAYPELGCTGEQLPVPGLWGVFDDVFCTKPETIQFLKNVLAEIVEIFPSETIHVGGDECPKVRWDACPACKKTREAHGLHDNHELQSYVIREMEAFLRSKGRRLMGWDEILEGGLADNAQVMSWRGTEGGIAAVKQGHPVVMTPTGYCYLDYYQSSHPDEPLAIGGYLPLEKVYSFRPAPNDLSRKERALIRGGQGNLWTEYLETMDAVEYSAFPRLVAMAEVLWTYEPPSYEAFAAALTHYYLPQLKEDGIGYSTSFLDPQLVPGPEPGGMLYNIVPPFEDVIPEESVLHLKRTAQVHSFDYSVSSVFNGEKMRETTYRFTTHPLIGMGVMLQPLPHDKYDNHGSLALTDGIRGKRPWKGSQWLGFEEDTVRFVIDLEKTTTFTTFELGTLHDPGSWIYHPKKIIVETSMDGMNFKLWKEQTVTEENIVIEQKGKAEVVRVTLVNDAVIPEGNPGAGFTPWTFVDELIIR